MMRTILITLLVTVAATVQAQPLLTLEDAVAIGLQHNYSIQIARNQMAIGENNKGLGTAGFLPTLNADGGYTTVNNDQEIDLPPSDGDIDVDTWDATVTLNWTVFDGFKMFINRRKFNDLAELGRYRARDQIENTVVGISRAYFDLVRQQQLNEVALERRDVSKDRLAREQVRNSLGGASRADFLNAQVAYNADRSLLLTSELDLRIARETLNVLLGRDPHTEFSVTTDIAVPHLDRPYEDILDSALDRNSALKAAELSHCVTQHDVSASRASFLPRVALFAAYGYSDQGRNSYLGEFGGRDITTTSTNATVGATLSLNLFNGGRDRIDLKNARLEAHNERLAYEDERNRLIGLVKELYDTYEMRLEIVVLEEQNIDAARSNLEVQQEQFRLGAAGSLDFRDAQVALARAETTLITARYQALIAYIELERVTGILQVE